MQNIYEVSHTSFSGGRTINSGYTHSWKKRHEGELAMLTMTLLMLKESHHCASLKFKTFLIKCDNWYAKYRQYSSDNATIISKISNANKSKQIWKQDLFKGWIKNCNSYDISMGKHRLTSSDININQSSTENSNHLFTRYNEPVGIWYFKIVKLSFWSNLNYCI